MPITKDNKFVTDNLPTKGYGKAKKNWRWIKLYNYEKL